MTRKRDKNNLAVSFRRSLTQCGMSASGHKIVLAVSGGPDSTALLHLLCALRESMELKPIVAHVNYGLRGMESDSEEDFVRSLAAEYDLPFEVERVNLKSKVESEGGNLQSTARRVRYRFFAEVARKHGASWIATGHTLDDQAETILFRLIRGAGRKGLSGIPAVRKWRGLRICRPLIEISRSEIESFLEANDYESRTDSSNLKTGYSRNLIRLQILPVIEQMNPDFLQTVSHLGEVLRDEERLLEELTDELAERVSLREDEMPLGAHWGANADLLAEQSPALLRRLLLKRLRKLGLKRPKSLYRKIELALRCILSSKPQWEVVLSSGWVLQRRYNHILILPREKAEGVFEPVSLPREGHLEIEPLGGILSIRRMPKPTDTRRLFAASPVVHGHCCYLDAAKAGEPMALRPRRPGDRMEVLGLGGRRKIKRIMMEARMPRAQRIEPRVLTCAEEIAWVLGTAATSERFKIDEQTNEMIEIKFEEKSNK